MNKEINKWNIIIENNKLDELNKNIDELQTENTNLKIELNAIKKELKDAHSYMNNKIIETNSSYLYNNSKNIPFHLQYENRFNKIHIPNYYTFSNTPISNIIKYNTFPIITLKNKFQPYSKPLYNIITPPINKLY